MSYKFKNGHIMKKIVTSSIIESEIKSKMLRESFENAEKIFLMKSLSHRSLENHFIGFFEKMRRHNWIKGESSMIDSLIALKVTNTLLLTCHQKELIGKNTFISFQFTITIAPFSIIIIIWTLPTGICFLTPTWHSTWKYWVHAVFYVRKWYKKQ